MKNSLKNSLREVTTDASPPTVCLNALPEDAPIYAFIGDNLRGMVVHGPHGWGIMTGGSCHAHGTSWESRNACVLSGKQHGFEFRTP